MPILFASPLDAPIARDLCAAIRATVADVLADSPACATAEDVADVALDLVATTPPPCASSADRLIQRRLLESVRMLRFARAVVRRCARR